MFPSHRFPFCESSQRCFSGTALAPQGLSRNRALVNLDIILGSAGAFPSISPLLAHKRRELQILVQRINDSGSPARPAAQRNTELLCSLFFTSLHCFNKGPWGTQQTLLPRVVSAVRFDEVHVAVFGQESHQLVVGPEERRQLWIIRSDSIWPGGVGHRNKHTPAPCCEHCCDLCVWTSVSTVSVCLCLEDKQFDSNKVYSRCSCCDVTMSFSAAVQNVKLQQLQRWKWNAEKMFTFPLRMIVTLGAIIRSER